MKLANLFSGIMLLLFLSATAFAQEEMTKEEWQAEINRLTEKKVSLQEDIKTLQEEVNAAKTTLAELQSYEDCMKELYAMVDAKEADIDNFRKKVQALEGKINRKEPEKADRQAELDNLKANKISALPEFYNKVHNELQRKLDAWVEAPKEINYTVVKGDHLWGIAKKDAHYGNPFAWPVIYKANRDQIKNPDLIYPAQVFKIPNLTDEEKAKYDKIRRNYKPAPADNATN
ncbi:MAG: hypothetical protein SCALA702_32840 [Melioribacteraceae bacterium]|nr:MAG: hypothetical protein SCALA702_32840 [Melioribacteraceae bacterium]